MRQCPLDHLTLAYHRPSGSTHMLADPVPQMLALMDEAPVDARTLTDRLAAAYDLDDRAEAMAVVAARLDELAALGLIEKVHGDA